VVGGSADGLEQPCGATGDDQTYLGVGVEHRRRRGGVPDGSKPRSVGYGHGGVVAGKRLVEHVLQECGLGTERGKDGRSGDAGRDRDLSQRSGGIPTLDEQFAGCCHDCLPGAPRALFAHR
jgi:hypothetical protein